MIIGLTGGIASGKSTVANLFLERGIKVYDADKIAREVSKSKEVIDEIGKKIDFEVVKSGQIDRKKLKKIVFENKNYLDILNSIMQDRIKKIFLEIKEENKGKNIVFDIPLLFENNYEKICDMTLLISTDIETQIRRIEERDNIDEELAKKIIFSQMPLNEKKNKADFVIENTGSLEELKYKVEKFCEDNKI